MSNPDSFIEEVNEEVRRDRLFAMLRRYGWIAVGVVLILVGGTAYIEWRDARAAASAQALGDAVNAALTSEDATERAAALQAVDTTGTDAHVVVGLLTAAEQQAGENPDAAAATLRALADDATVSLSYRQLATLKLAMVLGSDVPADERRALLQPLATPGATFRPLAEEQLALIDIETGDVAAAISRLEALVADVEATSGLRQRASQLIVALGGTQ